MFPTALIALDHSAAEGPMLECLADLRSMGVARVVLIHVVRIGYGIGGAYAQKAALEDWLRALAQPLRDAGLGVDIDVRAAGDVAQDVLLAATEHGAGLIVIGSRGQSMLRGLFLGSVAREILRISTIPVRLEWIEAIGKDDEARCVRSCGKDMQRLLLATDFSQAARPAEKATAAMAARVQAVDLVHVLCPEELARFAHWQVMAMAGLSAIADDIRSCGGKPDVVLVEGKPSVAIAQLASERDSDLIIVGKHGQNWAQSLTIGSTAAALCEIARRPVLMVPATSERA
jgi:nucleotide-binding universal stress UspA family protein